MIFDKKELQMIVDDDSFDYEIVTTDIIGSGRWDIQYRTIFKNTETGQMYVTYYNRGATEYQEEKPFEYDGDTIGVSEVNIEPISASAYLTVDGTVIKLV